MKRFIGVDPGAKGAVAEICIDGDSTSITVLPFSKDNLRMMLQGAAFDDCICCLEKVHAMPGQGTTSMFTFGENYGYIKGCLDSYGISYQEIPPQKWKKEFSLNNDKQRSIEVAHQLFPGVSLRATERCRVDNDGMAEALLMAEYARRRL